MASDHNETRLLHDLDALSQTLYQSHTARRTASLVLPRSSPAPPSHDALPSPAADPPVASHRPRTRRLSMSPFRSRPNSSHHDAPDPDLHSPSSSFAAAAAAEEKKSGIWSWKPMRALSHIRMQRLGCLFSVEAVAAHRLPPTMNGLRLSITVRKKETKDGAVHTMPTRVLQGAADFEETLFLRCHIYCSGGAGTGKPLKLEPRPFLVSAVAVDAPELDFGRSAVDLTLLVKESMEKNLEGARVRQWDAAFPLSGKAKGGELVVKLGFQIMEDGGVGIYNQPDVSTRSSGNKELARRQSKSSFSVTSPRITRSETPRTPYKDTASRDLRGIDDFKLDEPAPPPSSPPKQQSKDDDDDDDQDLADFDVEDKGVEIQEAEQEHKPEAAAAAAAAIEAEEPEDTAAADEESVSSEVVKEVVHNEVVQDSAHLIRMTELDAIAQQIKALESIMTGSDLSKPEQDQEQEQEQSMQKLDADEDAVTREFLQMLELEDDTEPKQSVPDLATPIGAEGEDGDAACYLSDLGKGLGSVVQTKDGGYLAAMNPLDVVVERKETPKLAMQISRPFVLPDQKAASGFEVFQKLSAMGSEELGSKLLSLAAMDDLMGKAAEQIAFEGMASAIISGRNKEGASSTAAKSLAALKTMSAAMSEGRKERILTGIWNVKEEPVAMEEVLALSLQKVETMVVEALKIQAGVAEEEAPFDASPLLAKESGNILSSAIPFEDWEFGGNDGAITLLVVVQLRDPLRRYETVGAPAIAVLQAAMAGGRGDEEMLKVTSLHVGGLKLRSAGMRSSWDGEKQRLTAMQWLVAYGLAKAGKRSKTTGKGGQDVFWSLSSRVMADMWLKPMRNPDVKVPERL